MKLAFINIASVTCPVITEARSCSYPAKALNEEFTTAKV
jgi:hypothetical protein